jgi:arylsulfatase A-like enzyme
VGTPPDILVIVLDCVRASDFPGGGDSTGRMPFVESLRKESIIFPKAVTVAPWTIPAHASLFTGTYPWVHGTHAKRSLHLDPAVPRLPRRLGELGYRTLSLSSNPLICPATGLSDGFDEAAWGSENDRYLRISRDPTPPNSIGLPHPRAGLGSRIPNLFLGDLPHEQVPIVPFLDRHVAWLSFANQFYNRFRFGKEAEDFRVARWIEPTLERWLSSQARDRPLFTFINLCDAHEPYFANSTQLEGNGGWRRYVRLRQDRFAWLAGRDQIPAEDFDFLHRLYCDAVEHMDRRLQAFVETSRRVRDWDNTLFVITSDHGQAFGDHGALFHRFRVDEPLIRIPLWVRMPQARLGGTTGKGWASLVDFAPTCLKLASPEVDTLTDGTPFDQLVDRERLEPVFALGDGTMGEPWIPESRKTEFDRLLLAAYEGDRKVVFDATDGSTRAYDVSLDPSESEDLWTRERGTLTPLATRAFGIARQLAGGEAEAPGAEIEERLRSWGYL